MGVNDQSRPRGHNRDTGPRPRRSIDRDDAGSVDVDDRSGEVIDRVRVRDDDDDAPASCAPSIVKDGDGDDGDDDDDDDDDEDEDDGDDDDDDLQSGTRGAVRR